jgi:hypothetical protein
MVPAHCLLDFAQNPDPLRARVPLPEKNKALAAHAATEFSRPVRAPAKDLHLLSSPAGSPIPPVTISNRKEL